MSGNTSPVARSPRTFLMRRSLKARSLVTGHQWSSDGFITLLSNFCNRCMTEDGDRLLFDEARDLLANRCAALLILFDCGLGFVPPSILVLLSVTKTRRLTAAFDAEDIARLCSLNLRIRPAGIGVGWISHTFHPLFH